MLRTKVEKISGKRQYRLTVSDDNETEIYTDVSSNESRLKELAIAFREAYLYGHEDGNDSSTEITIDI